MATIRAARVDASDPRPRAAPAGPRLTDFEATMWHVEHDPLLSSTFGSVTVLDRRPDFGRLRGRLARMAANVPRLHQRVVAGSLPLSPPRWEIDADFDLDHHVRRVALAPPAGRAELLELVQRFVQDPLDRQRPLWQYLLVEGYEGSKAALVQKTHHAVTDGIGGVRMSEQFVDLSRDAEDPVRRPATAPAGDGGPGPWPWSVLAQPAERALRLAQHVASEMVTDLRHPSRCVNRPGEVVATARSTARQLIVTDRARSPLWTRRTLQRAFTIFDVDLDEAHRAARKLGGSLNDLLIAGAAGAAGAYHRHQGAEVGELRVAMPVSTRRGRSAGGNAFVPTRLLVPATTGDPMERFAAVHAATAATRAEPAIGLVDWLAGVAVLLPAPVLARAARHQVATIDFTASNVRGAPFDLFIAGARIEGTYAVGPLGGTAFNLTMMSYSGTLNMGLHVDRGAVTDPDLLRQCLATSFAELVAAGS